MWERASRQHLSSTTNKISSPRNFHGSRRSLGTMNFSGNCEYCPSRKRGKSRKNSRNVEAQSGVLLVACEALYAVDPTRSALAKRRSFHRKSEAEGFFSDSCCILGNTKSHCNLHD